MQAFRDIPIRRKLTIIIMLTSGIGLLLGGSLTVFYEWRSYRHLMTEDLSTLAQVIGDQSTAAITFNDPKAAQENLTALQVKPEIIAAALYGSDGHLFARYTAAGHKDIVLPMRAEEAVYRFLPGELYLFEPISQRGEPVGTVYMCASLERMQAQLVRYVGIVAMVIGCLMLGTLGLSIAVQRAIADPILDLARAAHGVSEDKDYSVRVPWKGRDEIGELIITFNQMLTRIEEADAALRGANVALQGEVGERKRTEEELLAKTEETEAIAQQLLQATKLATLGELASSVAHELNNPLATVSLRVEGMLERASGDEVALRSLRIVDNEVGRMARLVSNLLQFSRRGGPQISTLDICQEISRTLELISYHISNRGIAVVQKFEEPVPVVQGDVQRVRQLFLNLFTNSCDAMPQGGAITIRVRAEGAAVLIEISDTGGGIPPEILPKVFDSFFTTKPEGKGTGLGLSICRRIVEEHRGTFELTSIVGKGTTAHLSLPVGGRNMGTEFASRDEV